MRIIVFCGNGGSGVSTVAAATAAALVESGRRTLLFGITSGLGDALGTEVGLKATTAWGGLDAAQGHGGHGGPDEFREWLRALLDWRGMDSELADDLSALPGVNHIGRLLELQRLLRSDDYDCAVLDAAEASQFLDLPGALEAGAHWLDRLFAPRQSTVFEPFLRAFAGDYANAGEEVFETGKELLGRLADVRDLMSDPEVTSVRVVAAPRGAGTVAVKEVVSVLSLFGYRMDAVVVNGMLPAAVEDPFFAEARAAQGAALEEVREMGLPVSVLVAELERAPIVGQAALTGFGRSLYGGDGPLLPDVGGFVGDHTIERQTGQYVVQISLPYARRDDLRLEDVDDGILVHLNGRRCVISLPSDVLYTEATSWAYEENVLRVVLDR